MFNKKLIKKNTLYGMDIEYYECKTKFNLIKIFSNLFNRCAIENWFEIHINSNKYIDDDIIMTFSSLYDYRKADIKLESLIKEVKYRYKHDINKFPFIDKDVHLKETLYYFNYKVKESFNESVLNEEVNYE